MHRHTVGRQIAQCAIFPFIIASEASNIYILGTKVQGKIPKIVNFDEFLNA